jgi:arabinogalactan endo-1,4-beta-galactosidase
MSEEALAFVKDLLKSIGIPYEFGQWNSGYPPDGYYMVGDYIEHDPTTLEENGHQEYTFILRGYTRGERLILQQAKTKIKKHIAQTAILPNGNGIAIFYGTGNRVPTGDGAVKSIKINLKIQEWSVN